MDSNKQIGTAAAFAQIVWVVSGLLLFMVSSGGELLSLSAAVFFIVGLLGAPAIFGIPLYGLRLLLDPVVPDLPGASSNAPQTKLMLTRGLLIAEAVVIFLAANWAFETIEAYRAGVPLQYVQQRDNFDYALKAFSVAAAMEEQAKPGRE